MIDYLFLDKINTEAVLGLGSNIIKLSRLDYLNYAAEQPFDLTGCVKIHNQLQKFLNLGEQVKQLTVNIQVIELFEFLSSTTWADTLSTCASRATNSLTV